MNRLPSPFPDIGPDPLKLGGDDYKARGSIEVCKSVLNRAVCVQQAGVPDQTALVWRADLSRLLDDHTVRTAQAKHLVSVMEKRNTLQALLRRLVQGDLVLDELPEDIRRRVREALE